jgi:hypothetical protein
VLSALKGKAGAAGANGAAGATGPAGTAGAKGEAGATGPQGSQGEKGKNGTNGAPGSPWTVGGTLPPEKTETGTWSYSEPEGAPVVVSISFAIPLAKALSKEAVHWIPPEEPTAECKGSAEEPKAAPGNLCVYQVRSGLENTSLTTPTILDSSLSIEHHLTGPGRGDSWSDPLFWGNRRKSA